MLSERLLTIAIDHFGRHGFGGASTRAIARDSGTAMSSITYHFGGKEGLYLEAARFIASSITKAQDAPLEAAAQALEQNRDEAIAAIVALIESLARMMLRPESESWARFIMREQQAPTAAFDAIYEGILKKMSETLVALVAKVREDLELEEVRATTVLMVGEAMMLRAGRASVCRVLGVETIDNRVGDVLLARLRANLLCVLSGTAQ